MVKETVLYEILGVECDASVDEISDAAIDGFQKYHPDKKNGNLVKFQQVQEAKAILTNIKYRGNYDKFGYQGTLDCILNFKKLKLEEKKKEKANGNGNGNSSTNEDNRNNQSRSSTANSDTSTNGDYHKNQGSSSRTNGKRSSAENLLKINKPGHKNERAKSPEIYMDITVTLGHLYQGYRTLKLTRKGKNSQKDQYECKVVLKPGITSGEIVTVKDAGDYLEATNSYQSINFKITIAPHKDYRKQGFDVIRVVGISFQQSLCGFEINIKDLEGATIPINILQPIEPGYEKTYYGKGLIKLNGARGDLKVIFDINYPKSLTTRQRTALNRWFEDYYTD
ncbi:DnaJ C terminal domain-containing protein [Scheffersomyces coipomensis]|uniref:DnaJ C terminal domain-containing protein n=1 Tax=Scheffersomyces coipomensis TaxID=1788519 RepID=UPI00315DD91C